MTFTKVKKKRAPDYQRERGERQENRILATLKECPKSSQEIATTLAMSRCNVELYMRRMHKQSRVHISSHQRRHSGRPAPVWAVGKREDAEFVPNKFPSPVQSVADRLVHVKEFLKSGCTSRELGIKLCVTRGRAQKYIQMLKEAAVDGRKVIYIMGWRHPGHRGDLAPIYKMGNRPDVEKPKETRAQRYAKEKADEDKYERTLQKNRIRHRIAAAKKKPQGIFAQLGL